MSTLKRRVAKLSQFTPQREVRVLRAMPNPEDITANRQQARELEAQGFDVLLIERVLVNTPV